MSHSDEDNYDVYSAIYSGNYEHYYQLILEAASKLFKARILQEYDLLYKLDFCDLFDVLPKLAPIYNLLIDIYKDKNNVNALEQAYKNGLESATEEAVRSLKTSLPIPDSKLDSLTSLASDLLGITKTSWMDKVEEMLSYESPLEYLEKKLGAKVTQKEGTLLNFSVKLPKTANNSDDNNSDDLPF